jgi:TIR domain
VLLTPAAACVPRPRTASLCMAHSCMQPSYNICTGHSRCSLIMLVCGSILENRHASFLMTFILLQQVYSQERVFISHAGPQKGFALHLRSRLRDAGVSAFVDERELLPGADHTAVAIMEAACRQAQLVVFVITHEFLRRRATLQELRWALDQRQRQQQAAAIGAGSSRLPHLLTVLYPTSVNPSWRVPELQQLLSEAQLMPDAAEAVAVRLNTAMNDAALDVGELQDGSLDSLLQLYHPSANAADSTFAAVTAQQAATDLVQLAMHTVSRADSVARLVTSASDHIAAGK